MIGVMLRRAWARPIASAAALLAGLTGVGLLLALPALLMLWRGGSREELQEPDPPDFPEPRHPPLHDRPSSAFTVVTALACVAVYLAALPGSSREYALLGGGEAPPLVTQWAVNGPSIARGEVWRVLSAGYLHAGVLHLLLNMVALVVAGFYVERRYGRARTALIYLGSLVAGNLLAAAVSAPGAYTLGASGAVMGLFAAMICVGARFRSERDSLVTASSIVAATLVYGFLHTGVSNSAHAGGLVAGAWLAVLVGTGADWTTAVRRREWRELVVSRDERRAAMTHRPPASVVGDPSSRRVLRMSVVQRLRRWALAAVFPSSSWGTRST